MDATTNTTKKSSHVLEIILISVILFLVACVACVLIIPSAGGVKQILSSSQSTSKDKANQTNCIPASNGQLESIRTAMLVPNSGVDLRNPYDVKTGFAVPTDYFNHTAYYVAAKIYGPGADNGIGPGVWLMLGDKDEPDLVFAVNSFAGKYAVFPPASGTIYKASMSDNEAIEVLNCAK